MADIREKILKKYDIDIDKDNIIKLYKIDDANISDIELNNKIEATIKRWNTSINGANEKNAARDMARLENAPKYEKILRDIDIRQELFLYYNNPNGGGSDSNANAKAVEFAREYFKLISTSKKISKADVDFFFEYYKEQRKNEKAIIEMLTKELKVYGLGKGDKESKGNDDSEDKNLEDNSKKDKGSFIVNLFSQKTIIKIKRAIESYNQAKESEELRNKFDGLGDSLYDFLDIRSITDAKTFVNKMHERSAEIHSIRQERGTEYIPLVDLFNTLQQLGGYKDVSDNIPEFKLLIKYPNLTPFMYAFVDMKKETLEGIVDIAAREYRFNGNTDFILNYYDIVYDNFGISNSGIGSIIKAAKKKARQNSVMNKIDEKLGRDPHRARAPLGVNIIHWILYWPLFVMYFVFYVFKAFFKNVGLLAIPAGIITFIVSCVAFPDIMGAGMRLDMITKLFQPSKWMDVLYTFTDERALNGFQIFMWSIILLALYFIICVVPALIIYGIVKNFSKEFNKHFDWVGYDRTFKELFSKLKKKTLDDYSSNRNGFVVRKLLIGLLNLLSICLLVAIIFVAKLALSKMV